MSPKLRLAISTCPNDTFAFHGLLERQVDWRGLDFDIRLLDIQQLNAGLHRGEFDIAKGSFFAALKLSDRMLILPSGAALGFGVGPLLLAGRPASKPQGPHQVTLCPGEDTTAFLLFQLFHPASTRVEQTVFSEIMPKLQQQEADFGVCIHEGRFTWEAEGLHCVEDLGTRWESETGCPLPLGGILASRKLDREVLLRVQAVIYDSLQFGLANRDAPLTTMRQYAQEFDDQVLMQHVDLYVNEWTVDLGEVGRRSLRELSDRARQVSLVSAAAEPLEVLET